MQLKDAMIVSWTHICSYQKRGKFDPKAIECVLFGYPDGIKGHKLWNLKGKCFFISRDVIFEEEIFPFKSEQARPHCEDGKVILSFGSEEVENIIKRAEMDTNYHTYQPLDISEFE